MTIEEIEAQVDRLPQDERGTLISRLIESLGAPEYDVSDEEVRRRVNEVESGEVQDISHEELLRGLEFSPRVKELRYHPSVQRDLNEAMAYYLNVSDSVADGFWDEISSALKRIHQHPNSGHPSRSRRERPSTLRAQLTAS